jgi:hypothetical protein
MKHKSMNEPYIYICIIKRLTWGWDVRCFMGLECEDPRGFSEQNCPRNVVKPIEFLISFQSVHWIGLRENLQETMVFTIKYGAFL